MTPSRTAPDQPALVSPVVDYEPAPVGASPCPSPTTLRRRGPRPQRLVPRAPVREAVPPRTAIAFADAALRRVLEVIDRRRPISQLRPLLAPALIDSVIAMTRTTHTSAATLRRVRVRTVESARGQAAEVFGTYTRGSRVRAVAARIDMIGERWRIVALQIG